MYANHPSVVKRLRRLTIGAVSIAALATGAYALSPAAPAHAATSYGGCTITPTLPTADSAVSPTGETLVNYRGGVFCPLGKTARVQRERWEQDLGAPDNFTGSITSTVLTPLWWDQLPLPDTDGTSDEHEEVYQRVRFQVTTTSTGSTTPWSAWELTNAAPIRQ
jgi:hypothetical protein